MPLAALITSPVSASPGVRDLTSPRIGLALTRASAPARTPATRIFTAVIVVLVSGILLSIATTPDPLWWQLHFSRLGTFAVFSSQVFNGTLIVTGALMVGFAVSLRRELHPHVDRSRTHRRAPLVVSVLVGSLGVHLAAVGCIPLTLNTELHDRAASGILLSFLLLMGATFVLVRGMGLALLLPTLPIGTALGGAIGVFAGGLVNLAAFELMAFTAMFAWISLFTRVLNRCAARHASPAASPASETSDGCLVPSARASRRRPAFASAPRIAPQGRGVREGVPRAHQANPRQFSSPRAGRAPSSSR